MFISVLLLLLFITAIGAVIYETIGKSLIQLAELFIANIIPFKPDVAYVLENKFPFYNKLLPSNKLEFQRRVKYFMLDKRLYSKGGMEINKEMKIMLAASFVQLTFGFRALKLAHFKRFFIYPSRYYSIITNKYHLGEVNTKGAIIVSWKDFQKELISLGEDGNPGIYEMAYAIKLADTFFSNEVSESNFLNYKEFNSFYKRANLENYAITVAESPFLRSHISGSLDEFFALSVGYFFDKPNEFKYELPELYHILTRALKQDPASGHFFENRYQKNTNI